MANEIRCTVVGNLTGDPELRFVPSGAAVVSFAIASTERRYDRERDAWTDAEPSYVDCQAWRQLAENVAESLGKGDRVIAAGVLRQERYETKEGEKRSSWRLTVDAIGPELTWAIAAPERAPSRRDDHNKTASANTADELLDAAESAGPVERPARRSSRREPRA